MNASTLKIVGIDINLLFNFQAIYLATSIAIPPPIPNIVSKSGKFFIWPSIQLSSTLVTLITFSGDWPILFFIIPHGISIVDTTNLPISFPIFFDESLPILSSFTFVDKLKYFIY